MPTLITRSGAQRELPAHLADDLDQVAGLDPEGRIVVDQFDARNAPDSDDPFMFGLSLCCDASDKGTEYGVVCRSCYGDEAGAYLYRRADGSFPGLDERVEVRP